MSANDNRGPGKFRILRDGRKRPRPGPVTVRYVEPRAEASFADEPVGTVVSADRGMFDAFAARVSVPDKPTGGDHLDYWKLHLRGRQQYVYVIGADVSGPVKIGRATNVYARLSQLQTGHPDRLALLFVVPGGAGLESRLHRLFAEMRVRPDGEWFGGTQAQMVELYTFVATLAEACMDVHDGSPDPPEIPESWNPFIWRQRGSRSLGKAA